ncbi:MAG: lysoplasmalogenase, partial [Deltaproteobacteria bacterium]|nr:lysoplasmalogenase [Deltaproteobacteria bacterium]
MSNFLILGMAVGLLAGLLYCEKNELQAAKLSVKTILSCLFILTVVIQSRPVATYYLFLLAGMLFCLGGDVFLALPQSRMFLWGLVSFLVGHVFYVIAFGRTAGTNQWTLIGLTISLIASGAVYLWLRPHLGTMKIAVICYMVVISAMAVGAWSMLGADHLKLSGRVLACGGALSFFVS